MLEPEHAFVLTDGDGVGGYVVGALDTAGFEDRLEREWWPGLRARYAAPVGPRGDRSPDDRLVGLVHRPPRSPAEVTAAFPSHLHIDLLPRCQGRGDGARLLETLFDALRSSGSTGVHLGVSARNTRAVGFYRHLGFGELARDDRGYLLGRPL